MCTSFIADTFSWWSGPEQVSNPPRCINLGSESFSCHLKHFSFPYCCALRGRSNYGNGSPSIDQKENHNVLATTTFHSKISNMMVSEFPVLAHGRLMGSTG